MNVNMDPYKSSKFRFLDSQPLSQQCRYTDILLPSSSVDQVVVRTNGTFFALPISAPTGQLYVRPVAGSERFTHNSPKLNCHRYAISSFAFDPFDSSILMTGADDGEVKMWCIPENGIPNVNTEPVLTFDGHRRKILNMEYNPSARDVFATGSSDGSCRIWNVTAKKEIITMDIVGAQMQEMKWDYTGSLLCTGTKNREYQIWDPRTVSIAISWTGHDSPRRSFMAWLGDSYYLVTTGYSKQSNREIVLRDYRNINNIIYTVTAENSPGPFVPFYNPCSHILWYSGRGDSKLNGIDVDDISMWTNRESSNSISVNLKGSVKSLAMFPQHTLNPQRNEIDRFVKINMDSGVDGIEIFMPHQSGGVLVDIYGKCPIPKPAADASSWTQGSVTKPQTCDIVPDIARPSTRLLHRGSANMTSVNLIKSADVKTWLEEYRKKTFSSSELENFQSELVAVAASLSQVSQSQRVIQETIRRSSISGGVVSGVALTRTLVVGGRKRLSGASSKDIDAESRDDLVTTDGVIRRTSIYKASERTQKAVKEGTAIAQLTKSKNRLYLNLSSSPPSAQPSQPSVQQSQPSSQPSQPSAQKSQPSAQPSQPSVQLRANKPIYYSRDSQPSSKSSSHSYSVANISGSPQVSSPSADVMSTAIKLSSPTTVKATESPQAINITLGDIRRNSQNRQTSPATGLSTAQSGSKNKSTSRLSVLLPMTEESRLSGISGNEADGDRITKRLDEIDEKLSCMNALAEQVKRLSSQLEQVTRSNSGGSSDFDEVKQSLSVIRKRLGC